MATADWASFRADQLTLQGLCTSFRGVLRCLSASHCFPSLLHYHGSFRYNIPIDIVTNSLLRSLQYPFLTSRGDGRARQNGLAICLSHIYGSTEMVPDPGFDLPLVDQSWELAGSHGFVCAR